MIIPVRLGEASYDIEISRGAIDLAAEKIMKKDRKICVVTDSGVPTPRMSEQLRKEAEGKEYKRQVKAVWAIETIHGILQNDFYIGTLRQSKYTRVKINGKSNYRQRAAPCVKSSVCQ